MRHDQLLDKIDTLETRYSDYQSYQALRAVVELHEPAYGDFPDEPALCGWCTCHDCDHTVDYPCKTIQKIEGAFNADL